MAKLRMPLWKKKVFRRPFIAECHLPDSSVESVEVTQKEKHRPTIHGFEPTFLIKELINHIPYPLILNTPETMVY